MSIYGCPAWRLSSAAGVLALLLTTAVRANASTAPVYDIEDLGTLGGKSSDAFGVNAAGQVVGAAETADGREHTYLWMNGQIQDLGTLGGHGSGATAINDAGQVVGSADLAGASDYHAFLWTNGAMQDLGTVPGDKLSIAFGINGGGQVVGSSFTADSSANVTASHAFLWSNGSMQDLGSLGGPLSWATAINASGQVVGLDSNMGLHAFLWANGKMQDLGTPGGNASEAYGINDAGQVVGGADTGAPDVAPPVFLRGTHAFRWTNGKIRDLGTLPGYFRSFGYGINAAGQVVGVATNAPADGNNLLGHAFFYSDATGMVDLNTRIDPTLGWELQVAHAINDAGQIVGVGQHNGQQRGFRLTPR